MFWLPTQAGSLKHLTIKVTRVLTVGLVRSPTVSLFLHYDKCEYCFIQEFGFKTTTIKLCNITTSGITEAQLCNGKDTCLPPRIPHSHYTWYLTGL